MRKIALADVLSTSVFNKPLNPHKDLARSSPAYF